MDEPNKATQRATEAGACDLRLCLLGEVIALRDGEQVALGGAKRSALLAVLGLEAPRTVSRAGIVDGLWGDQPPHSAVNTIQVHVSALRRTLGADVIITVGDGYRLGPRVVVDVHEFDQAVLRGVGQLRRGHVGEAAETLRGALSMWRGPALTGLDSAYFVRPAAERLEHSRLNALERCLEADLACGRHADVETELEALVQQHPTREQMRALLMQALSRSGRQAEALAVYDAGRRYLRDELGIDPSPTLKAAQELVLAQEGYPALPQVIESPGPVARSPLPTLSGPTIGRSREIAAVSEMLEGADTRVVTVIGPGGVGKTRLAIEVARQDERSFRDGVTFVRLAEAEKADDVAGIICEALGVSVGGDATVTLETALASRMLLLVCDNFEHVTEAAGWLPKLLGAASGVRILATSRQALRLQAERLFRLEPLNASACDDNLAPAVQLFLERARSVEPDFVATLNNIPELVEICQRCDGLPLAIELAAAHMRALSPAEVCEHLHTPLRLLDSAPRDMPQRHQGLRASIAWSMSAVPVRDADFLAQLTAFRGGFTLAAAASVTKSEAADAIVSLETLLDHSLIRRATSPQGAARFTMLETVREYAAEWLDVESEHQVRDAHAYFFRALLDPPPYPADLPESAPLWRAQVAERANLRQAIRWAAATGSDPDLFADLVVGVAGMWQELGPLPELIGWLRGVVDLPGMTEGRRVDAAYWLEFIDDLIVGPDAETRLAPNPESMLAGLDDDARAVYVLSSLAYHAAFAGRLDEARSTLKRARQLATRHPDSRRLLTVVTNGKATLEALAGEYAAALEAIAEGLRLARPDNHRAMLTLLNNRAEVMLQTFEPRAALHAAEEGVMIALELGESEHLAALIGQRGCARLLCEDAEGAKADFRSAFQAHLMQGSIYYALDDLLKLAAAMARDFPREATIALGVVEGYGNAEGVMPHSMSYQLVRPYIDPLRDRLGDEYEIALREGLDLIAAEGPTSALNGLTFVRS